MDSCGCGSHFIYSDPNKPFDGSPLTRQARKQMGEKCSSYKCRDLKNPLCCHCERAEFIGGYHEVFTLYLAKYVHKYGPLSLKRLYFNKQFLYQMIVILYQNVKPDWKVNNVNKLHSITAKIANGNKPSI